MQPRWLAAVALLSLGGCVAADDADLAPDDTGTVAQAASAYAGARWPTNPVTYYIDVTGHAALQSQPSCSFATGVAMAQGDIDAIHAAIDQYQAQTPVRFTELHSPPTWSGQDVLIFTHGQYTTNHASLIPTGTSSDYQGCVFIPTTGTDAITAEHETGHMLGLEHEQRREDRDTAVTFDSQCADLVNLPSAWDKDPAGSDQLLTPYDTSSLMEYGSGAGCLSTPACLDASNTCIHPPLLRKTPAPGCNPATDPHGCLWMWTPADLSPLDINALYYKYEPRLSDADGNGALGHAMTRGDFDGDGYDDLAVAAPWAKPEGSSTTSGEVYLYKGTEEGLVPWQVLDVTDFLATPGSGDNFGWALASADFDDDGDDDLVIGAPGFSGGGAVFLYDGTHALGSRQGLIADSWYTESSTGLGGTIGGDRFGGALALGKLDNSHWEIAIGAPNKTMGTAQYAGEVFLVKLWIGTWQTIAAPAPRYRDTFGAALLVTEFSGDGKPDLVVGAPEASTTNPGVVYLYRGGAAALAAAGTIVDGSGQSDGEFGASLAQGGLLGDYLADLVVGAPGKASDAGRVYVYQNPGSGYDVAGRTVLAGASFANPPVADDRLGTSLAVGDLDGDGHDDLVAGAPGVDVGGNDDEGALYLWQGGVGTLSPWQRKTEHADQFSSLSYDGLGQSVAIGRFGDGGLDLSAINDSAADLAAGMPGRDASTANSGALSFWFGSTSTAPGFGASFGAATHTSH